MNRGRYKTGPQKILTETAEKLVEWLISEGYRKDKFTDYLPWENINEG